MRVLNILSSRVTWLFETVELNPRGLSLHPVYAGLKNKYEFSTPKSREEVNNADGGVKFLNGSFRPNGGASLSVELTVYSDGLVALTNAETSVTEAFLNDMIGFVQKQYELHFEPAIVRQRRYGSSLLIESERGLSRVSELLSGISEALSDETGSAYEATGITLGCDASLPSNGLAPFVIERRTDIPFSANRFFSSAPVTTEAHKNLLKRLESALA